MTGVGYTIANPGKGSSPTRDHRGEFFEIWSEPITSHYSEVSWTTDTIPLPPEIVARFDGKVMVVVGNEFDIVRPTAENGTAQVLCTDKYLHHYSAWMKGKGVALKGLTKVGSGMDGHHMPLYEVNSPSKLGAPKVQVFSEGNGNEARGSYKGFPRDFGLLIDSPTEFLTIPMIINTNKALTDDDTPGPINHQLLPRNSIAPKGAGYSGLEECPCTDRIEFIVDGYVTETSGACAYSVWTELECTRAAATLGLSANATTVDDPAFPHGCSLAEIESGWVLRFNKAPASATSGCGEHVD